MNEFELIKRYFTRASGRTDVVLGVGDDAAILDLPAGQQLVAAVDTIIEGVHFLADAAPADIGYRALAVNLSDIAAMGAEPRWMTLALTLPLAQSVWVEGFATGLFELADRYGVALVGGDTCKGPLTISVQILGSIEKGQALRRDGARVGDGIYVSGTPGEAAAGLALLQSERAHEDPSKHLLRRFLRPEPRVALGRALRGIATAAMDVSDGVLADLTKLCEASGCGARVQVAALPPSAAMLALFTPAQCRQFALAGGDDYELLFTVPADQRAAFELQAARIVPCTRIGEITVGDKVECFLDGVRVQPAQSGFDHFGDQP